MIWIGFYNWLFICRVDTLTADRSLPFDVTVKSPVRKRSFLLPSSNFRATLSLFPFLSLFINNSSLPLFPKSRSFAFHTFPFLLYLRDPEPYGLHRRALLQSGFHRAPSHERRPPLRRGLSLRRALRGVAVQVFVVFGQSDDCFYGCSERGMHSRDWFGRRPGVPGSAASAVGEIRGGDQGSEAAGLESLARDLRFGRRGGSCLRPSRLQDEGRQGHPQLPERGG